jgi:hypothetical protein
MSLPRELTGLWRREIITRPGFADAETQVVWLQTESWYADLRIPPNRPIVGSADDCHDEALVALAQAEGFAGELRAEGGVCFWRRDADLQPPTALPDEGRYRIDGDVMVEDGVHADYQEIWRRAADGIGSLAAYRLEGPRFGLLVLAGDHAMRVIDRRSAPAPAGGSLAAAVEDALARGDRALAQDRLGLEICHAGRDGVVRLSNLPWMEGARLFAHAPRGDAYEDAEGRWSPA